MERVIKFRAWSKDTNEIIPWEEAVFPEWLEYSDIIVMQFTGLHDKKGKEIYEGDIVQWTDTRTIKKQETFIVKFGEFDKGTDAYSPSIGFYATPINNSMIYGMLSSFIKDSAVIGNIYENPELLK